MGLLKKRKLRKIDKYEAKLKEHKFNNSEITSLVSIYKNILSLSNILISNIAMFIISIVMIILTLTVNNSFIVDSKNTLLWVFGTISAIMVIVAWFLTLFIFIKVLASKVPEVRKKVLWLAILSIIPLISFITIFFMKWRVSHIYKHRK